MLLVLLQITFDVSIEDDSRDFILPCQVARFFSVVAHSFQFPEQLKKSLNCCRPYKSHLCRTCVYRYLCTCSHLSLQCMLYYCPIVYLTLGHIAHRSNDQLSAHNILLVLYYVVFIFTVTTAVVHSKLWIYRMRLNHFFKPSYGIKYIQ